MLGAMTTSTLEAPPSTQPLCQSDKIRRMAKPRMIQKTYRVPKALYEAAMAKAGEREESLSDVIRDALEKYAKRRDGEK